MPWIGGPADVLDVDIKKITIPLVSGNPRLCMWEIRKSLRDIFGEFNICTVADGKRFGTKFGLNHVCDKFKLKIILAC